MKGKALAFFFSPKETIPNIQRERGLFIEDFITMPFAPGEKEGRETRAGAKKGFSKLISFFSSRRSSFLSLSLSLSSRLFLFHLERAEKGGAFIRTEEERPIVDHFRTPPSALAALLLFHFSVSLLSLSHSISSLLIRQPKAKRGRQGRKEMEQKRESPSLERGGGGRGGTVPTLGQTDERQGD